MEKVENKKISIIGLGYVGLPLAIEFGKLYQTVGLDLDHQRITELKDANDKTMEVSSQQIHESIYLEFSYYDSIPELE